jgi:DNA (cytosine-5)-methyltransferase 1
MTGRLKRVPVLLDLFCCAGGAADGYAAAGFDVVGVDIVPQPNYPYEFIQADAVEAVRYGLDMSQFDAVHASPPCQSFTAYRRKGRGVGDGYENLIPVIRESLEQIARPYVIENVHGAPLENAIRLCGSSFGLDVRRHRYFESNVPLMAPPCNHSAQKPGRFPGATNRAPMSRATVEVGVWRIPLEVQKRAMGIDREVTLRELSEAIPPAFTEHIGDQLADHLCQCNPMSFSRSWQCPVHGEAKAA